MVVVDHNSAMAFSRNQDPVPDTNGRYYLLLLRRQSADPIGVKADIARRSRQCMSAYWVKADSRRTLPECRLMTHLGHRRAAFAAMHGTDLLYSPW
jgi:hypothetical protein